MIGVQELRAEVRDWLADNLVGEFAALKGLGAPGREDEAFEERRAWNQQLAAAGLTCLGWPVEHGGRGLSVAHRVAFYEEYALANAPAKVNHFGEELLGPTLIAFGTPERALTKESLAATYGGSVVTIPSTGEQVLLPADHHHHDH